MIGKLFLNSINKLESNLANYLSLQGSYVNSNVLSNQSASYRTSSYTFSKLRYHSNNVNPQWNGQCRSVLLFFSRVIYIGKELIKIYKLFPFYAYIPTYGRRHNVCYGSFTFFLYTVSILQLPWISFPPRNNKVIPWGHRPLITDPKAILRAIGLV